ncbi:hypothetical protein SAMN04489737_0687 [Arcanobacterium phocae]|uniref:Uncharacterized protein n=1 Tax=Arcanobacterium phocae TaxID=131112 RepID=A0A1H2LEY0_9ACTO|nr:hypothetical protein [Arcanobacterium phocae]SDU78966.1 hypothetical protein SAMN04489737_0687 [Arcanobacterium phocae]
MGFGGFGLAIVAVFLLIYLVPHVLRQRQVLGDAPIDERFAEDLRLIDRRTLMSSQSSDAHGKIFLTERIMTPAMTSEQLRNAARDRSRARARMATRHANQMRGMMIGLVLVVATLGAWGVVALTSFPSGVAIVSTVVTGAYGALFGYVINEMVKADDADAKRIAHANKVLRGQVSMSQATKLAEHKAVEVTVPENISAKQENAATAESQTSVPVRKLSREELDARTAALAVPATPSYTLKSVAPFKAETVVATNVPFRPTKLNERLGDESLPDAHDAPEMTGNEELRRDVLGGGSTLDALLSRRRA